MIQTQLKNRVRVQHETFAETRNITMPLNRVPSLQKIVEMFESGQPMDQTLMRNLEFNDFEYMPIYKKGFDIIDAFKLGKENKATLEQLNAEIQAAIDKHNKPDPVQNPATEPPTNLNE